MSDSAKRFSEGRNIKCGFGVALEKIAIKSVFLFKLRAGKARAADMIPQPVSFLIPAADVAARPRRIVFSQGGFRVAL